MLLELELWDLGRDGREPLTPGEAVGGGRVVVEPTASGVLVGLGGQDFCSELSVWARRSSRSIPGTAELRRWNPNPPGSWIHICSSQRSVTATCDPVGAFPLFHWRSGNRLLLSDNLPEIAPSSPRWDPAGLIEYLRFGYSIGTRTILSDVKRVQPAERITWQSGHAAHRSEVIPADGVSAWVGHPTEVLLQEFADALVEVVRETAVDVLMMSGGWDSRVILAALLALQESPGTTLHFHGDLQSREAAIVKRIASDHDLALSTLAIQPEHLELESLRNYFQHFPSLSFPWWNGFRNMDIPAGTVAAGIFGELSGGHYGPPMARSGWRRLFENARWAFLPPRRLRPGREDHLAEAWTALRQEPYSPPWYFDPEQWHRHFEGVHEEVNSDIKGALVHLSDRGLNQPLDLIEGFITTHRGGQYVAAQLHSASNPGMFFAPLAHRHLLDLAVAIPFRRRAFNRLTQEVIKLLQPSLLNYPMAATLVKAQRPIPLLEASRVARKAIGHLGIVPRSRKRFSWVNFQGFPLEEMLGNLPDHLGLGLWDRPRIRQSVSQTPGGREHPTIDMLMKILSADWTIVPRK